ncbi:MAG: hypothetical protein RIR91_2051, partial [Verrucomicrobiota bacterium]
ISLYYDSPDLRCYWDNWRGVPSRRKLRVRVYGSEDGAIPPTSFIEVKHKADGRGVKRRIQTTLAQALAVTQGAQPDATFSAHDLRIAEEVHRLLRLEQFRPSCVMRYDRHAYFLHLPEEVALGREPLRVSTTSRPWSTTGSSTNTCCRPTTASWRSKAPAPSPTPSPPASTT